ncbi:CDP-diacylglycerol--glycerol-3-phosphate 3-phosphatidyltransferase [Humidesulfovibrio mexicanus]|uniref:CDP-diacylglycerol--glycerol-3-phosphate 3-phosphatidyltransferase n=1 Tax=Humidesulfovibrio mexicanus TaxID=147047 RepID=A0A238XPV4_9BACT|nr:CDP-diacylglycerol--glycerol-3-phosphate 3-phosphatidyltransferase [Humidesulfovibrio mexicanus]SNR61005.1 CDP-diacylglycerol--glycerol-3-phosphate 3-phosphatidyltransferase [Humidesulfovibrio mexicanus]
MTLNLANMLTLARIFAVPVIVVLLYLEQAMQTVLLAYLSAIVFALASLTDMADGYVARRQNLITNLGKFLDPLADKLLIGSVLIMLVELGWVEAWIVVVIICRELAVTGMRGVAADRGVVIAADRFGKMKTIAQSLALVPLLAHYPIFGYDPAPLGMFVLYVALGLTVFSGGNYLYNFYKNWLQAE